MPPSRSARSRKLRGEVASAYARGVKGPGLEPSLVATITYFVTLAIVRAYTTLVRARPGAPDITIAGTHIHHVVIGVFALLISGVLSLDDLARLPRAALFGAGAALVLDELGLVVFLRDVYWLPEGVLSVAAVLIGLAALAVNAWRGRGFLIAMAAILSRQPRAPE